MDSQEALTLMQHKLATMIGMPSGYVDTLPKVVKRRIKALKKLQVESLKIESEFAKEMLELEVKYAAKYDPIWNKRRDITSGTYEPNDDECDFPSDPEDSDAEGEEDGDKPKNSEEKKGAKDKETSEGDSEVALDMKAVHGMDENTTGIPEFWLTIFKNVTPIAENIQQHDEPILKHLTDITLKQSVNPPSFELEFHFSPNDYFTNSVLTKTYILSSEIDTEDPFSFEGTEIKEAKGCVIDWKKGKNVTVRTIQKKQKHKVKGSVRSIAKTVKADSFFNFFDPVNVSEEEMDDDSMALQQADFEMGEIIKQRLIPRAVLYFTGEALDDDDDYDDEEDDEELEDEDDEMDEEGDNDDEEDEGEGKKKLVSRNGKRGGNNANAQECKQQ